VSEDFLFNHHLSTETNKSLTTFGPNILTQTKQSNHNDNTIYLSNNKLIIIFRAKYETRKKMALALEKWRNL